ncbi:MAG: hypothetical protein DRN66_00270 [Candidatus Nanohalarchaeota archaeon]|nr:MAG: hypothetical protein DRN66_00270 [Candidatus Nanohaloarchaeota archaeon]
MKKSYAIYAALIILILISGCNESTVVQTPGGVDIVDFSPLPGTVLSGEDVKLIYEIQNNGDYDADISLYIQQIDDGEWGLTDTDREVLSLAKKQDAVEGGKEIGFFQLTAPEIDRNTKQTYGAELKMCYPYTTKTVFRYEIINSFEKQKEIERGKYAKKLPFFKNSISPLLVYSLTKEPLFAGNNKAIISFKVKNEKRGMLVDSTTCEQNPDATDFNEFPFDITSADSDIAIDCDEEKIRLVDDSAIFYCTLTGISGKTSVTLTLESNYCYYQTKEARIVVRGI